MRHVQLPPRSVPTTATTQPSTARSSPATPSLAAVLANISIDEAMEVPQFKRLVDEAAKKMVQARQETSRTLSATTAKVLPGQNVYVAKISMRGSTMAGWCFFTHEKRYDAEEFAGKVADVCRIVNETRLKHRRQDMAKKQTPVDDPVAMNERLFGSDVTFFETVMADRHLFRILKYTMAENEIEGTVQGAL